jgi:hypothetical protein
MAAAGVEVRGVSEQTLRFLCGDCNEHGLIGSGWYASACDHRAGRIAWAGLIGGVPR